MDKARPGLKDLLHADSARTGIIKPTRRELLSLLAKGAVAFPLARAGLSAALASSARQSQAVPPNGD